MFKVKSTSTLIKWPVTVQDRDENGNPVETQVTIHYQFEPDYRKTKLLDSVVGWEGIGDAEGNVLPFSPENRDLLFGHLALSNAISQGFFALVNGEHLRKN
jgi:hypothetical protein